MSASATAVREPCREQERCAKWDAWHADLWQPPLSREALHAKLLALAPVIRPLLTRTPSPAEEWAPLDVRVIAVAMAGRGSCSPADGSRTIFVNEADPHELQRFTVAHELAHLLLTPPSARMSILRPADEEGICESFASELLIPSAMIARSTQTPPTPEDLLRLCGKFRVNVRPMLRAVGRQMGIGPYHLLLARWRGHWRRPHDVAFRIEASAGNPHVFIARDQRLLSMRLSTLATEGYAAEHGSLLEGFDECVTIGLCGLPGPRSSAVIGGRVSWQAIRQGLRNPYLLVVLDLRSVLAPYPGLGSPIYPSSQYGFRRT
jgi:hypothetical protein